ncbi:hypothetical protein SLA2020_447030 [Shorea laevis]
MGTGLTDDFQHNDVDQINCIPSLQAMHDHVPMTTGVSVRMAGKGWKKRAREGQNVAVTARSDSAVHGKRKLQPGGDVTVFNGNGKKGRWETVSEGVGTMYWRRLMSSPARCNECPKLELPWAWEPTDSL